MPSFSDKFIAFIDVLGFKSMVAAAERGEGVSLEEMVGALHLLGTGEERATYDNHGGALCPGAPRLAKNLDFMVTQVSDCVVVSAEASPAGLINLVGHCSGAVIGLMLQGIMCRGYIKRGSIYHTERDLIGSGYNDAYLAESKVSAFKREADERGTPYVELDPEVCAYVADQPNDCVRNMFDGMVRSDGQAVVLFPFRCLRHSFIVAGFMATYEWDKERESNNEVRKLVQATKAKIWSFVDRSLPSAVSKANHYIAALDAQLEACDETDREIDYFGAMHERRRIR
ncbi:MAG: hypothetical protein ABIO70_03880 [Pseudomonadota bacterium]